MKKCISLILIAVLLSGTLAGPAYAEDISYLTAEIDSNRLVTVKGTVSSGAGKAVNIKITDPKGGLEYADSIVSSAYGSFEASYTMTNNTAGTYKVLVNALGASPEAASFDYGTDNTLKALSISRGGFDKAFAPDIEEYAVKVDKRVESLRVTPTVNDITAGVKVNGTDVTSGSASSSIPLDAGDNDIKVEVSSLSGETKTYTITVNKGSEMSASIAAEASMNGDKNITVNGTINSGAGQTVTLKIMDPGGAFEYAGNTVSAEGGQFSFSYKLSNIANGRYTAYLGGLGVSAPTTASFDYFEMKSIAISDVTLKPNFRNDVISYRAAVKGDVSSVKVTPESVDSQAKITVNSAVVANSTASSPIDLKAGENTISVVLHGRDGESSRTYTITLDKDMEVVAEGSVSAEIDDDKLVSIYGTIGSNSNRPVTVLVRDPDGNIDYLDTSETSEKGDFQFSYTLKNEKEGIYEVLAGARGMLTTLSTSFMYNFYSPDLTDLKLSKGSLSPKFKADNTEYSAAVSYITGSIKVTPYALDSRAAIKVNGITVESGESSGSISLQEGQNTIRVVVTTPDEKVKTYTIGVTREYAPLSGDAYLMNLVVSEGIQDSAFNPVDTAYTVNVDNSISEITVTPTTSNRAATVTVDGKTVKSGSTSDAIKIEVGINYIYVRVRAENGNEMMYTLTVIRSGSSNAYLKGITASKGTMSPAFDKSKTDYTVALDGNVNSITLNIAADDTAAVLAVNGQYGYGSSASYTAYNLSEGKNVITIVVKAQDGKTKTYTVNVIRGDLYNADLAVINYKTNMSTGSLAITDPAVTAYTIDLPNGANKISLSPGAARDNSTIKVNGTIVPTNKFSGEIGLALGSNEIIVEVTAEDKITVKTYTITVNQAYNLNLSFILLKSDTALTGIVLTPAFAANTTEYTAGVNNGVSSITVTPSKAAAEPAVIKVDGMAVTRGAPSQPIQLKVGENKIYVTVTAPDNSLKTYTITVTRAKLIDATLNSLTVSEGVLNPVFDAETINYTLEVPSSTENMIVTPKTTDPNSTMVVQHDSAVINGNSDGSYTIDTAFGTQWIFIKVTAPDGKTVKNYNIVVTRTLSKDATLKSLEVSSGLLSPAFDPAVTEYTVNVANGVDKIKITPAANDKYIYGVTVDGKIVAKDSSSEFITLTAGQNKRIDIRVIPQSGTDKHYYVTVYRKKSSNANLQGLSLSEGNLNFDPQTMSYTVEVGNNVKTLKVTPVVADTTASVKVNNVTVASGNASGSISLNVGQNTVTVSVTAQDGTTVKNYILTVTRKASGNADLSGLKVGIESISLSTGVTDYSINVDNTTDKVTVTPTAADNAVKKIEVNNTEVANGTPSGNINLEAGSNTITVKVTAEDETVKTYTITVNRAASANATLQSLSLSEGSLDFDPQTTSYTVEVNNSVKTLKVTPTVADTTASVKVNNITVVSGSASGDISLNVGQNTVTISVTAQDGTTVRNYILTVTRKASGNADLSGLKVGIESISLSTEVTDYSVSADNATDKVTVTPTAADNAVRKIEVNNAEVTNGTPSGYINLEVGSNTITVKVTAEDGTAKIYTITVTRAKSDNAYLSGLVLKHGKTPLALSFAPSTTEYTLNVGNEVDSMTLTAAAAHSKAEVTVTWNSVQIAGSDEYSSSLKVGNNTIILKAKAENGTVMEYTITVTRAGSNNAYLKSLSVYRWSLEPDFNEETTSYAIEVYKDTESIQIIAETDDTNATAEISGEEDGFVYLDLEAVTENITITVAAEDGETTKCYTITVNRSDRAEPKYNVRIDGQLTGGTITPNKGTAAAGDTVTLLIAPNEDYRLKAGALKCKYYDETGEHYIDIRYDGAVNFIMPETDVLVTAEFELIRYTVTADTTTGGAIQTSAAIADAGDIITLTIMLENIGWQLKEGTLKYYDGTEMHDIYVNDDGIYSFIMPAADVTVMAEFEFIPPDDNLSKDFRESKP